MSPARSITTSPEGTKRRKLGSSSPSRILSTSTKMAPALIQEGEDEPDQVTKCIDLTPVESTLRQLLLDVAKYVDENPGDSYSSEVELPAELARQPIVLRFTGGWVRDKLLGVASHDIDVAVNKMTGYQFGLRLKEYLEIPANLEKYGLESVAATDKQSQKAGSSDKSKTVGGLHKIEANPEKSKHLETVTTRILGLDIDLVNLRKETYTDESRVPQMEMGTPEEDAMRRDATVNAMFYNINTQEIEDFTGKGHADMRDRIIRTPLEPHQTFKDDPLRVLRLIRFASRLDYKIEAKAQAAMRNDEIRDALRRKISRERVGVEIEKALRGPDPHEAMRLVFSLGLYETVFSDPTMDIADHYRPDIENWQALTAFTQRTLDGEDMLTKTLIRDSEERFLAWLLCALVPYRDAPQPEPPEPSRKAPPPIAASVAREGVKSKNKVSDVVASSARHQSEISDLVDRLHRQRRRPDKRLEREDASARDVLGMAVRRWGESWRSQVMYALLAEVASDPEAATSMCSSALLFHSNTNIMTAIERRYAAFIDKLIELDLLEACTFKPLMDGTTLAKALNTKPGPWMKDALEVVMAYQLRNPETATPHDAITEVQKEQQQQNGGELTSSLVKHFLQLTIRPLFLKAKPSTVTDAARKKTTTVLPKKITVESMDDSVNKHWKSEREASALDLLRWCVSALDGRLVEQVWPMVVPPCLTLIDDWEAKYKTLGVQLLAGVLTVTPTSLLAKTGLGNVFEEALMPCLAYLPTVTPEEESIPLLNATYPALLLLAAVRYRDPQPSSSPLNAPPARIKFLDTLLRKGILYGYTHCSTRPHLVTTLLTHLVPLLDALGIESVKHLKYLLPMLTETLCHPLASAHIETLFAATKGMQAVVLNCWPRIAGYRAEVLKGVGFCWVTVAGLEEEGGGAGVGELRRELRETVAMLRAAVEGAGEVDFEADCGVLVEAEPRLRGLLDAR